jgi:hypothetical protein
VKDSTTKRPKINIRNWECGVVIPLKRSTDPKAGEGLDVVVPMMVPGEKYEGQRPWFYTEQ